MNQQLRQMMNAPLPMSSGQQVAIYAMYGQLPESVQPGFRMKLDEIKYEHDIETGCFMCGGIYYHGFDCPTHMNIKEVLINLYGSTQLWDAYDAQFHLGDLQSPPQDPQLLQQYGLQLVQQPLQLTSQNQNQ